MAPELTPRRSEAVDRLSDALRGGQERARKWWKSSDPFIIVHTPPRPEERYYVQFYCDKRYVWSEAVSNTYLDDESDQLTDEQIRELQELGWEEPGEVMENFIREWRSTSDGDRRVIAEHAIDTLVRVYGLTLEDDLDIQKGWEPTA